MPIKNVVVNCTDVQRSIEYYTKFLELRVVGEPTPERAVLDAVTATIELRAVGNGRELSTWVGDDLQKGFRHIGFKVDRLDERAAVLKAAGVEFKLDPLDAEGAVRICFFYDPDGTLLEMIQGDLQYAAVLDADGVARERALGVPQRPRFDHVAVTIEDRDADQRVLRRALRLLVHRHDRAAARRPRFQHRLPQGRRHRPRGVHLRRRQDLPRAPTRRRRLRVRRARRRPPTGPRPSSSHRTARRSTSTRTASRSP